MPRFDDADRERRGTQTSGQLTQQDPADMLWKYLQTSKPSPWTNSIGQQLDPQTMAPIAQPVADALPPGPWTVDALAQGDAQARQALSGGGAPAPWELPTAPRVPVTPAGAPAPARPQSQPSGAAPAKPAAPSAAKQAAIEGGNADLAAARAQRDQDATQAMDEISAIRDGELKRQVAEAESGKVLADYQKGVDDLAKMVPDRNRWWSTRSGGQRFAAVISSALNTINQNMFGGGTAEDPITRFVNQDVEHQREEFSAKRARLDAQPGIYKMLRDRGLSDAAAATGARLEMLKAGKAIISDQLANAKDAQIIANGKAALAAAERGQQEHAAKMQEHDDKHKESVAEQAVKWAQVKATQAKPLPGGASDPLTRQVGNRLVRFKDEKEARNFDETVTAAAVHSDALDKLEELSKKPGIGPWLGRMLHVGSDFQTANAARDDITAMSNAAKGISTQMSQPVTERLNHALTPGLLSDNSGPIGIEREGSIKGIAQTLISQGVSPQEAVEAAHAAIAAQKVKFSSKGH